MGHAAQLKCGWEALESVAADPAFHDILEEGWRTFKPWPGTRPMPDWRSLFEMEAAGDFRMWTARDSEIVGFIQFQFYRLGNRERYAVDVAWWFSGENKSIWQALSMWRAAIDALRGEGMALVRGHDQAEKPLRPFFARLGMSPATTVYERML